MHLDTTGGLHFRKNMNSSNQPRGQRVAGPWFSVLLVR